MFRRYFWISLAVAVLLLGALTAAVAAAGDVVSGHTGWVPDIVATPAPDGVTLHVVRSGETLGMIARQ
ncbi:MAG: hypothetical protein WCI74_18270 [Actinomycetes bacterium]